MDRPINQHRDTTPEHIAGPIFRVLRKHAQLRKENGLATEAVHSQREACLWRLSGFFRPAAIEPLIPSRQGQGNATVKNDKDFHLKSDGSSDPPTHRAADIAGVGHDTYAKAKTIMRSTS